jgi:hypothetical protein
MKNILFMCCFAWHMVSGSDLWAQSPDETAKLRSFLMQESAEPGKKNYEQLGIEDINNIKWGEVAGLTWNYGTLEKIDWPNKNLSGNLDLSDFRSLKKIYLHMNNLEAIDVTTNNKLTYLRVTDNKIKKIDLSNNPELTFICCSGNSVDSLDFSNNKKIQTIYCMANQLSYINVQNCSQLRELSCPINNLTEIDVSNKEFLYDFSCSRNNISSINVLNCASLESFDCSYNKIESIDFSGCVNLLQVECHDNELKEIYLNDCLLLENLLCHKNLLDSLKLPESPSLRSINCKQNNLDFYSLPPILQTYTDYIYYPQNDRTAEMIIDSADFSYYYEIGGFISNYTWNKGLYWIKPEMKENGIFRFEESYLENQLICRIENETFPKLVLRYDVVLKDQNDTGNENSGFSSGCAVYANKGSVCVDTKFAADVRIFSLNGGVVFSKKVGEGRMTIPLDPGVYIVTLQNNISYKVSVR